ncbi:MAG: DEAD/DEAH box helicase [Bradymonadia bacterium]
MTTPRFSDLGLSEGMLNALEKMGYETPTPVQANAIPIARTGRDMMVQSQTGTGKTAAFGIPVIENIGDKPKGIKVLALCPTRELARQVAEEFTRLAQFKKFHAAAVYGGAPIEKQVAEIKFAHAVVGTPGRVLDHLRRRTLNLNDLQALVLDEADEMLSMGFARELEQIMRYVPKERQTLLFSATIPEDIKRYAKRYMQSPEFLSMVEENVAADEVEHHYYMISGVRRPADLVQVIEYEDPKNALIFTNTRADSQMVANYLKRQGYNAEYLNSDLPQKERERVMGRMKAKDLRFLVATDIAARGIDISQLSHVINYVLPDSPEVYIHRTGRTGRAGNQGTAISLIGPREIGVYYYLKRIYNVALQEMNVPTNAEIELRRQERRIQTVVTEIMETTGGTRPLDTELKAQAVGLLEREDAVDLFGALLRHMRESAKALTEQPAAAPALAGGMLRDVPQTAKVRPGSKRDSVEDVMNRVAIVQSEYRGLRDGRKVKRKQRDRLSEADRAVIERAQGGTPPEAEIDAGPAADDPTPAEIEAALGISQAADAYAAPQDDVPETEAAETEAAAEPAEEKPAPKRSRRRNTRKQAAEKPAEDVPAETAVEAAVEAAAEAYTAPVKDEEASEPEPEEKTARRRRRRRRPSAEVTPEVAAEAYTAPEPEVETAPEPEPVADPEPEAPAVSEDDDVIRLYVNQGRKDRIGADDLVDHLAELAGLDPEDFSDVVVLTRHSFITVEDIFVDDLLAAVNGESIGGRPLKVERARGE